MLFFSVWAIFFENKDQPNAYTLGKSQETDRLYDSIRKLKICMSYDTKTIKWRRILLATTISVAGIFFFVLRRKPEPRELLLTFVIIFLTFELTWRDYTNRTSYDAMKYGQENIDHIRSIII